MMKIYFAGSIRGGDGDRALYAEIIDMLRHYGTVLTEHVGNAKLSSYGEAHLSDKEIYERDIVWLKSADAVVAEVTMSSVGVGYELGFAEALGKQILCLYRLEPDKRLSAMIAGNPGLHTISYEKPGELPLVFKEFFTGLREGSKAV